MASYATSSGHAARTELPRPSRRDQSSRLPSKSPTSSANQRTGISPSSGKHDFNFGFRSTSNGKSGNTSYKYKSGNGGMNVVQPSLNVPVTAASPASTSTPQSATASDTLEPSPGADTPPPPSLVSGSSVSSHDSPRSNVLRRKPSVIAQYASTKKYAQKELTGAQPHTHRIEIPRSSANNTIFPNTRMRLASDNSPKFTSSHFVQEPAELTDAADGHALSRRTPLSEASTTPSLIYSASPSQYSHTTTATSLTSQSPMISSSPFLSTRPFTPSKNTSPRPSEPLGHPFFRQTTQPGASSTTSSPRPGTANSRTAPKNDIDHFGPSISAPAEQSPQKPRVAAVHPPELAHLTAASASRTNLDAPTRPSRNGTPNLSEQRRAQPVVHSNLPKLNTFQHRRKESGSSSANEPMSASRSPAARQTPVSARTPASEKPAVPLSGSQLSLQSMADSALLDDDVASSKASETTSKHKSRFGFFSRKQKQDSKDVPKHQRKGPAAGTGHEGYGKHTARARSGSSSSNASSAPVAPALTSRRKSSGASSKTSDLDDFLQQRLSPVYLRGETKDNESQGRASGSTFDEPPTFTPSMSSPETAHTSTSSADFSRPVLAPIALSGLQPDDDASSRGRPSIDQSLRPPNPSARSPSRKRLVKPRPAPKETSLKHVEAPNDAVTTPDESDLQRPSIQLTRSETQESLNSASTKSKKSRWTLFPSKKASEPKQQDKGNFLQRTKPPASADAQQAEAGLRDSVALPATAPAHYVPTNEAAIIDPEDLDTIMREAQTQADDASDAGTDFEDIDDEVVMRFDAKRRSAGAGQHINTAETASGVQEARVSEEKPFSIEQAAQAAVVKPTRLHPVGRIPPVKSSKDHVRKPPPLSFSRPFAHASPRPDMQSPPPSATPALFPPGAQHSQKSSASSGVPAVAATAKPSSNNEGSIPALTLDTKLQDAIGKPFFNHSPRKNSDLSYSSSSGTMHFPTATTIAHGPGRHSHVSADETWPEYDDLIDHVLTPSPSSSSRHSKGYFEHASSSSAQRATTEPSGIRPVFPKLGKIETFTRPEQASGKSPTKSSIAVDAPSEPLGAIAAALRDTPSLYTLRSTRSNSLSNSYHSKESAPTSLKHKRSNSLPLSVKAAKSDEMKRNSSSPGSTERIIQENPFMFRYRVLMTSKWLSFGRLLFSPIHNELGGPDDRVLVIDGLGNRDWSYYCAVSYSHTQIYSLGPSASTSNNNRSSIGSFGNLPNYRHFSYTTPGTDFPFPKGFFAAVVYRFPVANSDAVTRCIVSECKRVLRPGGYLEISTIDLDLSNMGTQCRRAVKNLKLQMRANDSSVSLKPASDHVQNLIGRRGFENLNRCIVGVPAAGVIGSSRENSQDGEDMDIGRLANDNSKESDDHITKMVAQVGRWWYTRSYEMGVLPNGDPTKSLWCDRSLLKECEELNTTFKLLICYAQKPNCAKRRTVSL